MRRRRSAGIHRSRRGRRADGEDDLRRLVRRDVRVTAAGGLAALAAYALVAAGWLGWVGERHAATAVVAGAAVVGFVCVTWWLAGPVGLRRERYAVLTPVLLIALPGLVSLHRLGGGLAVVLFTSLVAFSAAIAAGLAWSSRRR